MINLNKTEKLRPSQFLQAGPGQLPEDVWLNGHEEHNHRSSVQFTE